MIQLLVVELFAQFQMMLFVCKVSRQVNWPWWQVFAPSFVALLLGAAIFFYSIRHLIPRRRA